MADKVTGHLEIGHNPAGEIVINGGAAAVDEHGNWHIVFSLKQAENFAHKILDRVQLVRQQTESN